MLAAATSPPSCTVLHRLPTIAEQSAALAADLMRIQEEMGLPGDAPATVKDSLVSWVGAALTSVWRLGGVCVGRVCRTCCSSCSEPVARTLQWQAHAQVPLSPLRLACSPTLLELPARPAGYGCWPREGGGQPRLRAAHPGLLRRQAQEPRGQGGGREGHRAAGEGLGSSATCIVGFALSSLDAGQGGCRQAWPVWHTCCLRWPACGRISLRMPSLMLQEELRKEVVSANLGKRRPSSLVTCT